MKANKNLLIVVFIILFQCICLFSNAEAGTYIGELCFQIVGEERTTDYTFSVTHMGGNNYSLHGFSPQLVSSKGSYGGTAAHGSATISGDQIFMNFNISRKSNTSNVTIDSVISAVLDINTFKGDGHATSIVYTGTDPFLSIMDVEVELVPCQ